MSAKRKQSAPAEMKAIRNRYAGSCSCGKHVGVLAGVAHKVGAKWEVECATCFGGPLPRIAPVEKNKERRGYWITFTDGSAGFCEGEGAWDAVRIAEKITGKMAIMGEDRWNPDIPRLPYPANSIIWQFDHPVSGKCPPFCATPEKCKGNTSCPSRYACSE